MHDRETARMWLCIETESLRLWWIWGCCRWCSTRGKITWHIRIGILYGILWIWCRLRSLWRWCFIYVILQWLLSYIAWSTLWAGICCWHIWMSHSIAVVLSRWLLLESHCHAQHAQGLWIMYLMAALWGYGNQGPCTWSIRLSPLQTTMTAMSMRDITTWWDFKCRYIYIYIVL